MHKHLHHIIHKYLFNSIKIHQVHIW